MKDSGHFAMMSILLTATTLIFFMEAAVAQDPVSLAPQNYKVLFENDRVRILEYQSNPGDKTAMHSHPDYLVYDLADGYKVKVTSADGEERTAEGKAGTVSWQNAVTHETENTGSTEARALMIELKE